MDNKALMFDVFGTVVDGGDHQTLRRRERRRLIETAPGVREARPVHREPAYVPRPLAHGPGKAAAATPAPGGFDLVARDFVDLADQLGCPK